MMVEERYDLGKLVTFIPNKRLPVHNWFYFKEGFSRDFVALMFDEFGLRGGDWVLDPFCGAGTTLLTAKERGLNAFGVDVSPLFIMASLVKIGDYDPEELKVVSRDLFSKKFIRPDLGGIDPFIKRAFSKYVLEDVLFFRAQLDGIKEPSIRSFFTLALMNAAIKCSYAIKDGGVVKIYPKPVPPFREFLKRTVRRMICQLREVSFGRAQAIARIGDARWLESLEDDFFDAAITSPPYLNKIEYTTVYSIEYALFLGNARVDPVRSYIGSDVRDTKDVLPDLDLPSVAKAYFYDMSLSLGEIHRVLKEGGHLAVVVAGGVFRDRVVQSDLLLARLAEDIGLKVERILAVNRRVAIVNGMRIGDARESVLIMRK
jgi:DNA modification methylase